MVQPFLLNADLLGRVRERLLMVFAWAGVFASAALASGLTAQALIESNREIWSHTTEIRSMISTVYRLNPSGINRDDALLARYRNQHNDDVRDGINYILVVDGSGRIVLSTRRAWSRLLITDPLLARTETNDSQFRAIRNCFAAQVASGLASGGLSCIRDYGGFYSPLAESYTLALPAHAALRQRGSRPDNALVVVNYDPSIASAGFGTKFVFIVIFSCLFVGVFVSILAIFVYQGLLPSVRSFAETDELTGLLNRRACMDMGIRRLAQAETDQLPYVVAILDLDGFKGINDTYGHQCGDAVLREVSMALADSLNAGDLLARLGGEEFLVMSQCSSAHALLVMERLRAQVELLAPSWQGRSIEVSISIGLASTEQFGYNLDHLYAQADAALYRAKAMGRNRVCWSSGGQGEVVYEPWSPGQAWSASFAPTQPLDQGPVR